jgi:hypothetical protein
MDTAETRYGCSVERDSNRGVRTVSTTQDPDVVVHGGGKEME